MIFDTMRVYEAGRFHDMDLPEWYHESERLSEAERLDWHRALDRVLDCEHTLLTEEGVPGGWIEVRFWPSQTHGILVLFGTPLELVEQVIVPNPTDWLPFLTRHITPLIAATAQTAMTDVHRTIANAVIAWARHGPGTHVDRHTGLSRIDVDNDEARRKSAAFRASLAKEDGQGVL
jgi:hypothetical protein